ncbi:MAG: hypothetical protein R3A44_40825 [Caldilineaceae bacterium]
MRQWIRKQIRPFPYLYGQIRRAKYALWRHPLTQNLVKTPGELNQLAQIVANSASVDINPPMGNGPAILVFVPRAWSVHVAQDLLVAQALRMRGARVQLYTCGTSLPICNIANHNTAPPMPCSFCQTYTQRMLTLLGLPTRRLHNFVTPAEMAAVHEAVRQLIPEQFEQFVDNELPIGELVKHSTRWFLTSADIGDDPLAVRTYRQFLVSGTVVGRALRKLLSENKPDIIYMLNGLFFEERILMYLAKQQGIEVVTHENGFQRDTKVFAHNAIAPYYDTSVVWPHYRQQPLTAAENQQLSNYLEQRQHGQRDVARYYPDLISDEQKVIETLDLDRQRPIVAAFTNILWDSAVLDRNHTFADLAEWLTVTINYAQTHPTHQFVVRIHPAEIRLTLMETRQKIGEFIAAKFPALPPNVRVVPPESSLSSYTLMRLCHAGLVYTSTVGLELILQGKPVIICGATHYADRGFAYHPNNAAEYIALLDQIPFLAAPTAHEIELAHRYAHLFFFKLMMPFPLITTLEQGRLRFNINTLSELQNDANPALDEICQGILAQRPFLTGAIPPAVRELYAQSLHG